MAQQVFLVLVTKQNFEAYLTCARCGSKRTSVSQPTTLHTLERDGRSELSWAGSPSRTAVWKLNDYSGGWSGEKKKKKKKGSFFRALTIRQTLSKSQCVAYHCSFVARLFVLVLRANFLSAWKKKWRETNWTGREAAPSARLRRGALKASVCVLREASVVASENLTAWMWSLTTFFFFFFNSPKNRFSFIVFKIHASDAS